MNSLLIIAGFVGLMFVAFAVAILWQLIIVGQRQHNIEKHVSSTANDVDLILEAMTQPAGNPGGMMMTYMGTSEGLSPDDIIKQLQDNNIHLDDATREQLRQWFLNHTQQDDPDDEDDPSF